MEQEHDDITEKVVSALSLKISQEERSRLTKRYTENVKAYNLYLLGRHQWNKITPSEIQKSIDSFEQAWSSIRLRPGLCRSRRSLLFPSHHE